MGDVAIGAVAGQRERKPRRKWPDLDRYERTLAAAQKAERERRHSEFENAIRAAPLSEGLCYFLGSPGELVKIGYSRNVHQRINKLKGNAGPMQLSLLATARGGESTERAYHRRFAEHSIGNEWFEWCPEIEAEIARLASLGEAA